jgi:hypothetical protein
MKRKRSMLSGRVVWLRYGVVVLCCCVVSTTTNNCRFAITTEAGAFANKQVSKDLPNFHFAAVANATHCRTSQWCN